MRRRVDGELELNPPLRRRACLAGVLGVVSCIGGCKGILGIEELNEGTRLGVGQGGDSGAAGSAGSGANASGSGGVANGMSGSGGGGSGSGSGGAASGGSDAGMGDAGVSAPITVAGRVIDFYRRPVPDLLVTVAGQEALTDEGGEFTFYDVAPPYDVSLVVFALVNDFQVRNEAFVYEGLTRPDPTLQVYYGLTGRDSTLLLTVANTTLEDDRNLSLAFSSPDGHYAAATISGDAPSLSPFWTGPASTAGNVHGLVVLRSATGTGAAPLAYEAYETTPLALDDRDTSSLTLDMSADVIPPVILTGSVDVGTLGVATNLISTRFADGTVLPLVSEVSNQGVFSYLVPSLPSASLTVAAAAGSPAYSVAHVDGVPAAGSPDVELVLPRPVAPTAPANGAQVGPGTTFAWSTLGQSARVFVWHLQSLDSLESIYVITARSQIEYPELEGFDLTLPTDGEPAFYWTVETHGDYASVDAASEADGFYDSFALEKNVGTGLPRGSQGYYTSSELRFVEVVADP